MHMQTDLVSQRGTLRHECGVVGRQLLTLGGDV